MATTLWTSRLTGTRRRGTQLSELKQAVGLSARAILEPLKCCSEKDPAIKARAELDRLGFDSAGVASSANGRVSGYVLAETLNTGRVGDHRASINPTDLIAESAPLGKVLVTLRDKSRVFVLVDAEVAGIITKADLNKPPVRVYLFGAISLLELHLTFWARRQYPRESWKALLDEERIEGAKKVHNDRVQRGQDIDLFDCLQLCDKKTLLVESTDLRAQLGLGSKTKAHSWLGRAETLRNGVAHSQADLSDGISWEKAIDLVGWMETVIERSEAEIGALPRSVQEVV